MLGLDARAKARAYHKGKNNGKGKNNDVSLTVELVVTG